jgi:hypothetical protein
MSIAGRFVNRRALLFSLAGQRRIAMLRRRAWQQWARAQHFTRMARLLEARAARLARRQRAGAINPK